MSEGHIVHHHHEQGHPITISEESHIVRHHHEQGHNPIAISEESHIVRHHHEKGHPHHHQDDSSPPPPPPVVPQYGTFGGGPHTPAMGFPQPVPPRGTMDPRYYSHGYQAVPGYVIAEGTPMRDRVQGHYHRLPCCGIGYGWFLFIIGFLLAGIPWYIGAFFLICCKRNMDEREKPGYVGCTIAAVIAIIATIFGVIKIGD